MESDLIPELHREWFYEGYAEGRLQAERDALAAWDSRAMKLAAWYFFCGLAAGACVVALWML